MTQIETQCNYYEWFDQFPICFMFLMYVFDDLCHVF